MGVKLNTLNMSLDERFNKAAEDLKNMTVRPTDEELKEIYALYKQGTVGDVNTDRPGMMDFKGKAKWDAWKSKSGMTQEAAKEAYVAKVTEVIAMPNNGGKGSNTSDLSNPSVRSTSI